MAGEFGSLMMGGIEKTFETLGVTAGFQAVMKGLGDDVDTSDAGLEKLFKEIDAEYAPSHARDSVSAHGA
jgi:hypothetical protein